MGKTKRVAPGGVALRRWMTTRKLECVDVRAMLLEHGVRVTRQAVHHWREGVNAPRRPAMKALVIVTGGAVPLESW